MTNSESYGTPGVDDEVLGVLTGQVPVRSMPLALRAGLSNDEIAALLVDEHEGDRIVAMEDISPDEDDGESN